jgi:replication factor A1
MSTPARRTNHRGPPPPGTGYVRRATAPAPAPAPGAAKTLRKPVFTTIDQLRPQTHGHTLTARVVEARTVLEKRSPHLGRTRVAECLVGDHTGTILVTARNDQGTSHPTSTISFFIIHVVIIRKITRAH